MLLKLERTYNKCQTDGILSIDGKRFCRTIEPPQTPTRNHPKGCIPEGWYRIDATYSPHFKRILPLLRMVPGFTGIRIHAGLSVDNTQGCICVGYRATEERLTQLLTKVQNQHEEIYIHIYDAHHDDYDGLPYNGPEPE